VVEGGCGGVVLYALMIEMMDEEEVQFISETHVCVIIEKKLSFER